MRNIFNIIINGIHKITDKNFYSRMLTSFLLISVIFIFGVAFLLNISYNIIRKETQENMYTDLLLFTNDCENTFSAIFNSSSNINTYFTKNKDLWYKNNNDIYAKKKIADFISSQQNVITSVQNIIVYTQYDAAYTESGAYDLETIYYSFYNTNKTSYSKWNDSLNNVFKGKYDKVMTTRNLNRNQLEINTIELRYRYMINDTPIVIIYTLDPINFFEKVYDKEHFAIKFSKDTIFSRNSIIDSMPEILNNISSDKSVKIKHDGCEYVLLSNSTSSYGFTYVYLLEYDRYRNTLNNFCLLFGVVFIVLLLLFLIASLNLAKRNYRPIKSIVEEMNDNEFYSCDEVSKILMYMKKNKCEIAEYKNALNEYDEKLKSVGIEHILNDIYHSQISKQYLFKKYKLNFEFKNYYVIVIDFKSNDLTEETINFCNGCLSRINNTVLYQLEVNNTLVFVINCNNDIYEKIIYNLNSIKEYLKNDISVAVSLNTGSVSGIAQCYKNCLSSINETSGDSTVTQIFEISNFEKNYLTLNDMDVFELCFKSGNSDYALLFFKMLCDKNMLYGMSFSEAKNFLSNILVEILKYYNSNTTNILSFFSRCVLVSNMIEYIEILIPNVAESYNKKILDKKYTDQFMVLKFIEDNLSNNNLSVSFIADEFEFSTSYISAQFKKLFGVTLIEYIQKKRSNEALKMLINSNKSVQEISYELGFTNSNVFIRLFKKYIKVTPGEFRKTNRVD